MRLKSEIKHKPVLFKEVLELLHIKSGGKYIDATVGGAGHAVEICKRGGKVLALDCDPKAVGRAQARLKNECPSGKFKVVRGNFVDLKSIAYKAGFTKVDGILFDLGVSSCQLDEPEKGLSFSRDEPLDMRLDPDLEIKADYIINKLSKGELNEIFTRFGEEKHSLLIAEAVVRARRQQPIKTTGQLSSIIMEALKTKKITDRHIHPATRVFQALRIAVNQELKALKEALPQALQLLKSADSAEGGRLAVISFHSLEDRIVKLFFRENERLGLLAVITKKPLRPSLAEVVKNRRARSARLRIAQRQ